MSLHFESVRGVCWPRNPLWLTRSMTPRTSKIITILAISLSIAANTSGQAETARYLVEVDNTWSPTTHPGAFPADAHFSWMGGGVHNDEVSFWTEGVVASPGIVQMAETGVTTILAEEVTAEISRGNALAAIDIHHWFCPELTTHPSCDTPRFEIEASTEFSRLTLATMLGPSPDWFVGLTGFPLHGTDGWTAQTTIALFPYDGGTRIQNRWLLGGTKNVPPEPIFLIPDDTHHLVGSSTLGTVTLTRIIDGDFNQDGTRDVADIDLLSEQVRSAVNDSAFDLTDDGRVDQLDRIHWVELLAESAFGDAGLDGIFNSSDLVQVFRVGEYEDEIPINSNWADGDWDGNQDFDSSDLVFALQRNRYVPGNGSVPVPEPTISVLLFIGAMIVSGYKRHTRSRERLL